MNALKISPKLKNEIYYLLIVWVTLVIVFRILFTDESLVLIIKLIASFFWLFVIPGFALMYYWNENLNFLERLIMGTMLGAAIYIGIGYNIGRIGLPLNIKIIVIPLATIIFSYFLIKRFKKNTVIS